MSRGLGRIERTILDALQATPRPYVALWEVGLLVEGRIASLDDEARHWGVPICQPHPKVRHPFPGIGMVDHLPACYAPEPARSVQEAVARAVRSLARKGVVRREYEGTRPKCLMVGLPTADPLAWPRMQRHAMKRRARAMGIYWPDRG
jgi:hypothetical protein